jgi:nitrite reductase/ring-hydroxylating ferredoxin subunit
VAKPEDTDKRRTLRVLASATGCAALGLVGGPCLRLMIANADAAPSLGPMVRVPCHAGELELDRPRRALVSDGGRHTAIWLVRSSAGIRALSGRCPHLGCSVGLAEDQTSFLCPCHHATFSLSGARLAGETNPAPRDMDALELRVDDATGELDVRVVQYLPGSADQVVVGGSG